MTPKPTNKVKKVKKIKWGRDVTSRLYKAVMEYVEKNGGTAVVIGGIALVQESPLEFNYGVMVRVTGRKPSLPTKTKK